MLELLTTANPITSVVTGLLGALGSQISDHLAHKRQIELEKFRHEANKDLRKHELELLKMNMDHEMKRGEQEMQIALIEAESEAFTQSIKHDMGLRTENWVDKARALVRPIITFMLVCASIKLGFMPDPLSEGGALVVNLTITTVTWWFGSRFKPQDKYTSKN